MRGSGGHRRIGERPADLHHVDRPHGTFLGNGDTARPIDVAEELERHVAETAASLAPRTDHGRQAADRAERGRTVGVVLHTDE